MFFHHFPIVFPTKNNDITFMRDKHLELDKSNSDIV